MVSYLFNIIIGTNMDIATRNMDINSVVQRCVKVFALLSILSHTVIAAIHEFNLRPEEINFYKHIGFSSYGPKSHEWFGPPHGGHRSPGYGLGGHMLPNTRYRPRHHGFGPPHNEFGSRHGGFGGSNNEYEHSGYGYNRPKNTWNENNNYPNYDNYYPWRAQNDDYWVFPDSDERYPPRPPFPPASPPTPPVTSPPATISTSSAIALQECIRSCPVTSQYNPVCGTNNMTYSNIGRLECAIYCGVDVQVKRMSPCPTPAVPGDPFATADPTISTEPQSPLPFTPETTTEIDFEIDIRQKEDEQQ